MSNEEAYAHMQSLIIQSQTAFVPQMVSFLFVACFCLWFTCPLAEREVVLSLTKKTTRMQVEWAHKLKQDYLS